MTPDEGLLARFEEQRPHLRAVAYRMLGSFSEADDVLQEAWIRLDRTGAAEIENLGGWLRTVVARICLNVLRSRRTRREEPLAVHMPELVVGPPAGGDPEHEALLADSVGLALLVVLEMLSPPERLAFVLHDIFGVPFDEIAALLDRTPAAARQLASRARRRVQDEAPVPDSALPAQREVVDAFFAAGRSGDLGRLVALLQPGVTLRADVGAAAAGTPTMTRGADAVGRRALFFATVDREVRPVTVNGTAGALIVAGGRPVSIMGFTVVAGRIAAIDVLADPARLARIDLGALERRR